MMEYDLAVKYDDNEYILPCYLNINHQSATKAPYQNVEKSSLPLVYRFHLSVDSYKSFQRGRQTHDYFLPHGFFNKLVVSCAKLGWKWTENTYYNSVGFIYDNTYIQIECQDTNIKLQLYSNAGGICLPSRYHNAVQGCISRLLRMYHPNIWIEYCTNPCEAEGFDCLSSTGRSSLGGKGCLIVCNKHGKSLSKDVVNMWFGKSEFN